MILKSKIKEILDRNGIKYSVRDYYKLGKKNPKMIGLHKQYGITYFIKIGTIEFNFKLKIFKESESISIYYEDGGGNVYFGINCKIDNLEEKIRTSMYLIDSHLSCIRDMSVFASGKTPINVTRGLKIDELASKINNI